MTRSFPLAPMDRLMTALTAVVLAVPVCFAALSLGTGPGAVVLAPTALALVGLYAGVWLFCRPTRFEVHPDALAICFPLWTRRIDRSRITAVDVFHGDGFRRQIGWGLRVGVGGLWGGFGWLITPIGTVEFYISRAIDLVLVRIEGQRDLLVSPSDLDGFASALAPDAVTEPSEVADG